MRYLPFKASTDFHKSDLVKHHRRRQRQHYPFHIQLIFNLIHKVAKSPTLDGALNLFKPDRQQTAGCLHKAGLILIYKVKNIESHE